MFKIELTESIGPWSPYFCTESSKQSEYPYTLINIVAWFLLYAKYFQCSLENLPSFKGIWQSLLITQIEKLSVHWAL